MRFGPETRRRATRFGLADADGTRCSLPCHGGRTRSDPDHPAQKRRPGGRRGLRATVVGGGRPPGLLTFADFETEAAHRGEAAEHRGIEGRGGLSGDAGPPARGETSYRDGGAVLSRRSCSTPIWGGFVSLLMVRRLRRRRWLARARRSSPIFSRRLRAPTSCRPHVRAAGALVPAGAVVVVDHLAVTAGTGAVVRVGPAVVVVDVVGDVAVAASSRS
jgi:hypothetical protein